MLVIERLTKKYGSRTVLNDVDLNLPNAGLISILGPSGSGKTTLLRAISGLLPENGSIVEGKLVFEQNDLTNVNLVFLLFIYILSSILYIMNLFIKNLENC